jgi:EAL domain-containing protein (putative c-di-GMP-specific phosphodiesterase class I)/GGDEF domain-containing protein
MAPNTPVVPVGKEFAKLRELSAIIDGGLLTPVFQPIIRLDSGEIFAYEALIRGPEGSALHSPFALFHAAERNGRLQELEWLCVAKVVDRFGELGLPETLFVNIGPQAVALGGADGEQMLAAARGMGKGRSRIVIELTEHQPARDTRHFHEAMALLRGLGFGVALDDLGEGFSSLKLWSDIHPEYIKIDMHFVQGVHADPFKFQFLRSLQQIAENCGAALVAEGIENEADLRVLSNLGVTYGQGYLIAHPSARPATIVPAAVRACLENREIAVYPDMKSLARGGATVTRLLQPVQAISPAMSNDEVFVRFEADPDTWALPVVHDGAPLGIISRYRFIAQYARPYWRELYGKRPCTMCMEGTPLVVEKTTSVHSLSELLAGSEHRSLADGFVIVDDQKYAGLGTTQDLIREITRMQLEAARYANPLTMLPGNVPINEHMERLLAAGVGFVACYADLDEFKPFNDKYGYRRGDEMIKLTAAILAGACNPGSDFLGHIGGDDFIILFQSADWESRCTIALESFARDSRSLFDQRDLDRGILEGEDRRGNALAFALTSLSLGAVQIDVGEYPTHLDVAAAATDAKKQAKRISGNSLFVERRRPALALSTELA